MSKWGRSVVRGVPIAEAHRVDYLVFDIIRGEFKCFSRAIIIKALNWHQCAVQMPDGSPSVAAV